MPETEKHRSASRLSPAKPFVIRTPIPSVSETARILGVPAKWVKRVQREVFSSDSGRLAREEAHVQKTYPVAVYKSAKTSRRAVGTHTLKTK
jgi:hypothetical protein